MQLTTKDIKTFQNAVKQLQQGKITQVEFAKLPIVIKVNSLPTPTDTPLKRTAQRVGKTEEEVLQSLQDEGQRIGSNFLLQEVTKLRQNK